MKISAPLQFQTTVSWATTGRYLAEAVLGKECLKNASHPVIIPNLVIFELTLD